MYDSAIYTAACGCQIEGSAVTKCLAHEAEHKWNLAERRHQRRKAKEQMATYDSDRLGRVTIPE